MLTDPPIPTARQRLISTWNNVVRSIVILQFMIANERRAQWTVLKEGIPQAEMPYAPLCNGELVSLTAGGAAARLAVSHPLHVPPLLVGEEER